MRALSVMNQVMFSVDTALEVVGIERLKTSTWRKRQCVMVSSLSTLCDCSPYLLAVMFDLVPVLVQANPASYDKGQTGVLINSLCSFPATILIIGRFHCSYYAE